MDIHVGSLRMMQILVNCIAFVHLLTQYISSLKLLAGISPQNTLFFMLVSPLLLFLSYFILLVKPNGLPRLCVHRRYSKPHELCVQHSHSFFLFILVLKR